MTTEKDKQEEEKKLCVIPVKDLSNAFKDIGKIIVTSQRVIFTYLDGDQLQIYKQCLLDNSPLIHRHNQELMAVFFPHPDSRVIYSVESEFIEKVENETGKTYILNSNKGSSPDKEPVNCRCSRLSDNKVAVETENGELEESFEVEEFRLVSCADCFTIYGIYGSGKKKSLSKVFSADWVLEDENVSYDSIIETESDSEYALYHSGDRQNRLQDVSLTLSLIGQRSDGTISTYKHKYQKSLLYVIDDEIVGYLSWQEVDGNEILSQLFVREEYRSQGVATSIIQTWYTNLCKNELYLVEELTEGGRSVIEKIGHLGNDSEDVAVECCSLVPPAFI